MLFELLQDRSDGSRMLMVGGDKLILSLFQLLFEFLNLSLLGGDGLGELMIVLALFLQFALEFLDCIFQLRDNDFIFADKIQLQDFGDLKFHDLLILVKYLVLFELEDLLNPLKSNVGIRRQLGTVESFISLCIDQKGVCLDCKYKADNIIFLLGDVVLFVFHFRYISEVEVRMK